MLNQREVVEQSRRMSKWREDESERLDKIHAYYRGIQASVPLPSGVPREVKRLAAISRVNVARLPVDTVVQQLYVDGFRAEADDQPVWDVWQANQQDARQTGVHRAAVKYGSAYNVVLPGTPVPVTRGVSPRRMTAVYGEDPTWPMWAWEDAGRGLFKLYDDQAVYHVSKSAGGFEYVDTREHGLGVCPIVRYLNVADLDDEVVGEVEPLFDLQDQINITTFGLLVAQHYGAFRQRYILGWLAETEEQKLKAGASKLWTFQDSEVKVGEFEQTDLAGYLESRESTVRYLGVVSQTPPQDLLGQLVNLSAEALAAAEANQQRKIAERKVMFGEAHEQTLNLAAQIGGFATDPSAQVVWRDTEARALASTVDALGKLTTMLGVPPEALWERIPGVTQTDIQRWKALAMSGDSLGNLTALLEAQSSPVGDDQAASMKARFDALGAAVRAGATFESAAAQLGLSGLESSGAVPVSLRLPESEAEQLEGP